MMDFTFLYVSTLVIRMPGESDRAWKRRRHSAMTKHRKAERARRREAQRRGWTYRARPLDVIDTARPQRVTNLDVGRLSVGTIRASRIQASTITATNVTDGAA